MSEHKIVYLLIERGTESNKQTFWRPHGVAYVCRDGSLNLKLDIHPGLTFNIRDPKSNAERDEVGEAMPEISPHARAVPRKPPKEVVNKNDDDIPF
jgi:hypothetical protein